MQAQNVHRVPMTSLACPFGARTRVFSQNEGESSVRDAMGPLRLIALIKTETIIKRILAAMHLPTEPPQLHPPRPPPGLPGVERGREPAGDNWLN